METKIEQLTAALVAAQAGVMELQQQQAHAWQSQVQKEAGEGRAAAAVEDAAAAEVRAMGEAGCASAAYLL